MSRELSGQDALTVRLVHILRSEWVGLVELVDLTRREPVDLEKTIRLISTQCGKSEDSLTRKVEAIGQLLDARHAVEEIESWGESRSLQLATKYRKQANPPELMGRLSWVVPVDQKERVLEFVERVKKVIGISTSAQFFDFLLGALDTTDEELRHLAGEKP